MSAPLQVFKRDLLALTRRPDLPLPGHLPEAVLALKNRAWSFLEEIQRLPFRDPEFGTAHLIISPETLVGLRLLKSAIPDRLGVQFDPPPGTLGIAHAARILGCPVHLDDAGDGPDLCSVTRAEADAFTCFLRAGRPPRDAAAAARDFVRHASVIEEHLARRFGRAVPR